MANCSGIECTFKDTTTGLCKFTGRCALNITTPVISGNEDPIASFADKIDQICILSNYRYCDALEKIR